MLPEPKEKPRQAGLAGIPVKGWLGLLFTLAFMGIILYAVPPVRWFLLFSIPPGLIVGAILYILHRQRE